MGLNYSFEIITDRNGIDRLLEAVANYLTDESRGLLSLSGPEDAPALAFHFPPDGALLRYSEQAECERGRFVDVGQVETSLSIGVHLASFQATATGTTMSLLFEESSSVRNTFSEVGRTAQALSVLFERDAEQYVQIWPDAVQFIMPCVPEPEGGRSTDTYCESTLAAASAARKDCPPQWPSWEQRWLARDREFYSSLGRERAEVPCRMPLCSRGSVALSVFCRVHHFEQVLRRRCPFND